MKINYRFMLFIYAIFFMSTANSATVMVGFEGVVTDNTTNSFSDISDDAFLPSIFFGTIEYDDSNLPRSGTSNQYINTVDLEITVVGSTNHVWSFSNGDASVFNDVGSSGFYYDFFDTNNLPPTPQTTLSGPSDGPLELTYIDWRVSSENVPSSNTPASPLLNESLPSASELEAFELFNLLSSGGDSFGSINISFDNGTTNINGILTDLHIVPIPAALPLFASVIGLMGIVGWRRKKAI